MAIQKEFIVRYRAAGHIRFDVPPRAVQAHIADRVVDALSAIDGVYAVKLSPRSRKLSIRYHEASCGFIDVAKQMVQRLSEMEQQGLFQTPIVNVASDRSSVRLLSKFHHSRVGVWWRAKLDAAKETAQAAKLLGKLASQGPKALVRDPEKAIIDFLNDILVMYLIKTHWTRITQQWLVKPFTYRYEWLATFYLFFLLVRSRKRK
ncbi:MAG: hypothetical protein RLZ92_763 [Pseudomonadota bacterium]|jgi:hypothetical protein